MIAGLYEFTRKWHERGTLWIYSDPHFGDKELAEGQVNRPSDEEQIKMINSKVGRADAIIFLGDIGDTECIKRIRGYKILICGNHDAGRTNYTEVFDEVYTGVLAISDKILLSHEPMPEHVLETLGMINCSGHNHAGTHHPSRRVYNFCAEAIGFTPVNFNQFVKSGALSIAVGPHRAIIDKATAKAKKRSKKK